MPVTPPSPEVLAQILGPTTIVTRRIELYENDASTLWKTIEDSSGRLITGSVTVGQSDDVRRSLDLTLDNRDGGLRVDPNDGLWYDKIIKVYRGVITPEESWEVQIGEFMIDRLSRGHFPRQVKITGRDYVKKCLNSKFTSAITFTAGKPIEQVVAGIAIGAGIKKMLLPITGRVTGRDFTFDRGSERWIAMRDVASAYGFDLYFDATGYLVLDEYKDPVASPVDFTFETGPVGSLASYETSTNDTRLYNHVLVTGESSEASTPPVAAEAINTEPSSPTNIDRIGDRLYTYSSSFITTVTQARDVAAKFLKIHALEQFEVSMDSVVLPWIDAGSIVEFIDPDEPESANHPSRFLLTDLTIPLGLGTMNSSAKRVTIVTDDGSDRETQSSSANRFVVGVG